MFKSTSSYIYLTFLYSLSILSCYFAFDWRKMFGIGYVSGIANHGLVNTKNISEHPYFAIIILMESLCQLCFKLLFLWRTKHGCPASETCSVAYILLLCLPFIHPVSSTLNLSFHQHASNPSLSSSSSQRLPPWRTLFKHSFALPPPSLYPSYILFS